MKKILILAALFFSSSLYAQQNFQGMIIYRLHTGMGDKPDAELKVIFGNNKLKLAFKEKAEYDDEEVIVLLDSAARYVVNRDHRTFNKRLLNVSSPKKDIQKKSILGYSTTALQNDKNGLQTLLGGFMSSADAVFYLADSLYYMVPEIFQGNPEFLTIQKDRIVLGAEIEIKKENYEVTDSSLSRKDIITAEAIEIKPMIVNDDEFLIPADYTDYSTTISADSVSITSDSTVMIADTIYSEPSKKKPARKPVKKPVKQKTTVKSAANKRKE